MRQTTITGFVLGTTVAAAVAVPALAADMPVKAPPPAPPASLFGWEVGAGVTTNYIFRGTTQSNNRWSANAYATATWADRFYLGVAAARIEWPTSGGYLLSDPAAEVDFYGGITWEAGKWSFDVGGIYYYYPSESFFDSDFWEVYGKASYAVTDELSWSGAIYYSPDYLNYGIAGTTGTLGFEWSKSLPNDFGFYVSGEIGRVWLGARSSIGVPVPNYNFWSAGFGWTWKAAKLDLRYHDTDLSGTGCTLIWNGGGTQVRNWCGAVFVATYSVSFSSGD